MVIICTNENVFYVVVLLFFFKNHVSMKAQALLLFYLPSLYMVEVIPLALCSRVLLLCIAKSTMYS